MTANTVLNLWHEGHTADEISDYTGIHRDTVFKHLRQARARGDARAARRPHQKPAHMRRIKIAMLASLQIPKRQIAKIVGVSYDTVKLRLREEGIKIPEPRRFNWYPEPMDTCTFPGDGNDAHNSFEFRDSKRLAYVGCR